MNSLQVKEVSQMPKIAGGFVFNSPEFLSLKEGETQYFVLFENKSAIARICFVIDKNQAFSGHQATFGSIDANLPLARETAKYFLEQVIMALEKAGIYEVIIKHWPAVYIGDDNMHKIFGETNFKVISSEVNQHLAVQEEEFKVLISKNERKKLNQCLKQGYTFMQLTLDEFTNIYQLVTETRVRKGYPVSMTHENLYKTIKLMPDKYLLFGLFDGDKLIAASVSIRVSHKILYNFYHADDLNFRTTSPLVMLIQQIYQYCQQNGIEILDLGVSSENGLINQGLFNFKKNLGCVSSEKNTYRLIYA
jgi:hypothetical protein